LISLTYHSGYNTSSRAIAINQNQVIISHSWVALLNLAYKISDRYIAKLLIMTKLLEKAFQEAQKLSDNLQNEIVQQLLIDIENELKWQETLANPDINLHALSKMAQAALIEDQEGKTEAKGFGEE